MSMHNNFQFSIFNFQRRGFTLIETMIAVTILTLSIAGPLFTAGRAIVAAQTARDQLTASYLAQEGIEYVRAMRDDEYLLARVSSVAWTNFLAGMIAQCTAPGICTLGLMQGGILPLISCPNNSCTTSFSLLTHGTPFIRTIQAIGSGLNEETIVSKVSWNFHGLPYSVTTTGHLTPWQ